MNLQDMILNSINRSVIATDAEGRITYWNDCAQSLYGWSADEVIGKNIADVTLSDTSLAHVEDIMTRLRTANRREGIFRVRRKDGTEFTAFISDSPMLDDTGALIGVVGIFEDLTEREAIASEREATIHLLGMINVENSLHELMELVTEYMHDWSGCDAVGIRLREGEDYPYFETRGFAKEFVLAENSLCAVDENGKVLRNCVGNVVLECMCGNIIDGRFDPAFPFFTSNGSFWTNSTSDLLDATSDEDRQVRTRNRCHGEGYESVALIPLRTGRETLGLLQFNDRSKGKFTPLMIEMFERLAENLALGLSQRIAAKALRESEARLNEAERLGRIGNIEFDVESGSIYWSEFMYELYQRVSQAGPPKCEEFMNMHHADDAELLKQCSRRAIEEAEPYELDIRFRPAGGRIQYHHMIGNPVVQDGKVAKIFGTVQDITEGKQADEERKNLQNQLNQAQKMESVGRLAGGVAHDFNNMLSVIIGHTEMALEAIDGIHPIHDDLQEIYNAAERSAGLVRQLLAFARRQTIAPKTLDLNQVIEGMLKMLRRLIGEDIDLEWKPANKLWAVSVDPVQIDQILANLCVNARDAIKNIGTVSIETSNAVFDIDYCAKHAGFLPGEYVMVSVTDNGSGMDKDTVDRVFEPFFTTKKMGEGTGLGLATVYGIVKQNGGFITADSTLDNGSTFKIFIPRYQKGAKQQSSTEAETENPHGRETILLVEDEEPILNMTKKMLERLEYTVLAAATPGEAIRISRDYCGAIQLLMTDVIMPEMNGRDLAKNLTAYNPGLKRLFMSGYTADIIAHHGVLDEGVNFIQKPFSLRALSAKLREVIDSE